MTNGLTMYWITRAAAFHCLGYWLLIISTVALAMTGIITFISYGECRLENEPKVLAAGKKWAWKFFTALVISILLTLVLPSKDDMIMIAGAELSGNAIKELSPELNMVRQWLDKELDDKIKNIK